MDNSNTQFSRPSGHRTKTDNGKSEPSFRVRTTLDLDMNLAYELGVLILESKTSNIALVAMGHQLVGD